MPRGRAFPSDARKLMQGRTWWTRRRVLAGMQRFYRDHGFAPTSTEEWHRATRRLPGFRTRGLDVTRPYPSFYAVLRWFATFREAWVAAGVEVDRTSESWSPLEEWYLREATGILSRNEIAADLKRTPGAVHRHLYDLGLNARDHWGWTLNRLERVTSVQRHVWQKYMDWGDLPYFHGNKFLYVDPADLVVVGELDMTKLPPELEEAMLRSLRERLLKILAGQDWRRGRIFQVHQVCGLARIHNRRVRVPQKPDPRPAGIEKGDTVRVVGEVPSRYQLVGRVGFAHFMYWAFARTGNSTRKDTAGTWMARVEFKSQHNRAKGPRVTYSIPLAYLARVSRTAKRTCPCGAVIVWRADEPTPNTCAFCRRALVEVSA